MYTLHLQISPHITFIAYIPLPPTPKNIPIPY